MLFGKGVCVCANTFCIELIHPFIHVYLYFVEFQMYICMFVSVKTFFIQAQHISYVFRKLADQRMWMKLLKIFDYDGIYFEIEWMNIEYNITTNVYIKYVQI